MHHMNQLQVVKHGVWDEVRVCLVVRIRRESKQRSDSSTISFEVFPVSSSLDVWVQAGSALSPQERGGPRSQDRLPKRRLPQDLIPQVRPVVLVYIDREISNIQECRLGLA